jgi:transposase InsO family protein
MSCGRRTLPGSKSFTGGGLSTILDDYSRYIITWRLCASMSTEDVKETIEAVTGLTGVRDSKVLHRPRLLSDNGACHVSKALKEYLNQQGFAHTHHPMTRGKIERYHRSMKNITAPMSYLTKSVFLSTITIITAIKKR